MEPLEDLEENPVPPPPSDPKVIWQWVTRTFPSGAEIRLVRPQADGVPTAPAGWWDLMQSRMQQGLPPIFPQTLGVLWPKGQLAEVLGLISLGDDYLIARLIRPTTRLTPPPLGPGVRVMSRRPIDRYPHARLPADTSGKVVHMSRQDFDDGGLFASVRLESREPGLDYWNNEVWYDAQSESWHEFVDDWRPVDVWTAYEGMLEATGEDPNEDPVVILRKKDLVVPRRPSIPGRVVFEPIWEPVTDTWGQPPKPMRRYQLPKKQRSWLKPNQPPELHRNAKTYTLMMHVPGDPSDPHDVPWSDDVEPTEEVRRVADVLTKHGAFDWWSDVGFIEDEPNYRDFTGLFSSAGSIMAALSELRRLAEREGWNVQFSTDSWNDDDDMGVELVDVDDLPGAHRPRLVDPAAEERLQRSLRIADEVLEEMVDEGLLDPEELEPNPVPPPPGSHERQAQWVMRTFPVGTPMRLEHADVFLAGELEAMRDRAQEAKARGNRFVPLGNLPGMVGIKLPVGTRAHVVEVVDLGHGHRGNNVIFAEVPEPPLGLGGTDPALFEAFDKWREQHSRGVPMVLALNVNNDFVRFPSPAAGRSRDAATWWPLMDTWGAAPRGQSRYSLPSSQRARYVPNPDDDDDEYDDDDLDAYVVLYDTGDEERVLALDLDEAWEAAEAYADGRGIVSVEEEDD